MGLSSYTQEDNMEFTEAEIEILRHVSDASTLAQSLPPIDGVNNNVGMITFYLTTISSIIMARSVLRDMKVELEEKDNGIHRIRKTDTQALGGY